MPGQAGSLGMGKFPFCRAGDAKAAAAMGIGAGDLGIGRHPVGLVGHALLGRKQRQQRGQCVHRYLLPLLEDEYADLQDAHNVRGAGAGNGIRDRLQRWQRFTVPFLFSALQRAQVTALAMDSKAFGAYPTKTFYHQVAYPLRGKIFSAFWISLLLLSIYLLLTGQLNIAGDIFMA